MSGFIYTLYVKCFLVFYCALNSPNAEKQSVGYFLNNIHVRCIEKFEKKSNDLIYIKLISKDCGRKNTPTKAFKDGDEKVFSEINLDDLSKKNGWCVKENDLLKIMAKNSDNDDEVLFEIKFTTDNLLKRQPNCFKILRMGNYEVCFEVKTIKLE